MFNIGEKVKCIKLSVDNVENLKVGMYYEVVGVQPTEESIVYGIRNEDKEIRYAIGDLFERRFVTKDNIDSVITENADAFDIVQKPAHYNQYRVEVIDVIEDVCKSLSGIECVSIGNVIKYIMRYQFKNGIQDLKKARFYLEKAISTKENILVQPMKPMSHQQKIYIASLTKKLDIERTELPDYLSPIKDYHGLTEVEASGLIEKLLVIKSYGGIK